MTTFLSRRAALLAAGAGAITMLSACTSDIRPLADSSASGELRPVPALLSLRALLLAHPLLRVALLRSLIWGR